MSSVRHDSQACAVIGTASRTGFETAFISRNYMEFGFAEAIDHDGAILGRSSVVRSETPLGWDLDTPVVAVTESGHDRQRQGTTLHQTWTSTHANGLFIGGSCLILVLFGAVVMLVLQRPHLLSAGYRTALLKVIKDKHFRGGEERGLEGKKLLSSTSAVERD
jgi:hypothetical protein